MSQVVAGGYIGDDRASADRLARVEARYQALLEGSLDAVLIVDGAGRILEVNGEAERLLGRPMAQLVARRLDEVVRGEGGGALKAALARLGTDGPQSLGGVALARADGTIRQVDCRLSSIIGPVAAGPTSLLVARDVSERVRLEHLLRERDKLATVGALSAGIAHEISNPAAYVVTNLTSLRATVDELRHALDLDEEAADAGAPAERREVSTLLDEIDELTADSAHGGERIQSIAGELRVFSRTDDMEIEPVDVEGALEGALRFARREIRLLGRLERRSAPSLARVLSNANKLSQVFLNLVMNALQAMEGGAFEHNVVSVRTSHDGGWVRIDVGDTGGGIDADVLPRVFEPFFTTKPTGKGTGLGLSICREIIRLHGGEISVESTVGAGTTFSVRLPAIGEARPVEPPRLREIVGRASFVDPAGETAPAHILIVDDEPHLLKAYQRLLARRHTVTTALGGRAALAVLASVPEIDLVISDLVMPDVDGIALYEALRSMRPGLEKRMIFVTGGAFTERAGEFLESVDNARLDKPIAGSALLRAIARALGLDAGSAERTRS